MLCAVLVLLAVGWLLKLAQGRWLAPGPMFCAYWALFLGLPPLLAPQFVVTSAAVWYITLLVAAFSVGSWAAAWRRPVRSPDVRPHTLNLRLLRWLVVFGTVAGLAAAVIIQRANGQSISAILSLATLLDASSSLARDRYTGGIATPALVPLLLAVTYASALVAAFAAQGLSRRSAVACYLGPMLGAIAYAATTTARSGMVTAAAFLATSWVASRIRSTGATPTVRGRTVLVGLLSGAAVFAAFIGISFLRVGSFEPHYQRLVFGKLAVYGLGYLPGFSYWFGQDPPAAPTEWGAASFAGVAKYLGAGGTYNDALTDFAQLGGGATANIYTAWRYLIADFGWIGAILAAVVLGYVATAGWRMLVQRPTTTALVLFMSTYAYLLHTNVLPIFTFTNTVAAVAIAGLALHLRPPKPKPIVETPHERDVRRARARADL